MLGELPAQRREAPSLATAMCLRASAERRLAFGVTIAVAGAAAIGQG